MYIVSITCAHATGEEKNDTSQKEHDVFLKETRMDIEEPENLEISPIAQNTLLDDNENSPNASPLVLCFWLFYTEIQDR